MIEKQKVYPFNKIDDVTFEYERKDGVKYQVIFEETVNRHFLDTCNVCSRLWEVSCLTMDGSNPCKDYCSNRTLVEIVKEFLKNEYFEGVLFRFYDGDGDSHRREMVFNRIITNNISDEFDKICNETNILHERFKFCVIIRKNSEKYEEIVENTFENCIHCKK